MSNANIREAHRIVTNAGSVMTREQIDFLRSMLPPLPKQKTLEELCHEVYDVWVGANENEWPDDIHGELETWLSELHTQLQGLNTEPATPAHPEFLETEADYENAPEGTIVASAKAAPIMKCGRWWESAPYKDCDAKTMADEARRVLRWGWGK